MSLDLLYAIEMARSIAPIGSLYVQNYASSLSILLALLLLLLLASGGLARAGAQLGLPAMCRRHSAEGLLRLSLRVLGEIVHVEQRTAFE